MAAADRAGGRVFASPGAADRSREHLSVERAADEFVAPEERGKEAASSVAGDVFSLGKVILYVRSGEGGEK